MGHVEDAYEGVAVEVPTGPVEVEHGTDTLRLRCLTVREGSRFLRLLSVMEATGGGASVDPPTGVQVEYGKRGSRPVVDVILDEFPAAVGLEEAYLTPVEVLDVLRRFLAARRTPTVGRVTDEAAAPVA